MADFTLEQYQALNSAIAGGTLRVKYQDKDVTYRTLSEMITLRELMRNELGLNQVAGNGRYIAVHSKGF